MKGTRVHKSVSKVKWSAPRKRHYQANFTPNNSGRGDYSKGLVIGLVIVVVVIALIVLL